MATAEKAAPVEKGAHDVPVEKNVGDYSERPYLDAVTPEHLEVLKEAGQA